MAQQLILEELSQNPLLEFGIDTGIPQIDENSGRATSATGYETGYQAGWEDAANATAEEQGRISAEFSHNLQDLGFTFHEAKSHVMRSLGPILNALVETMLPELVAKAIGPRILEEIRPMAETAADAAIQIVTSPKNSAALEPMLRNVTGLNIELVEEPSLGVGQVFLRSPTLEKHIDLEDAISNLRDAVAAVQDDNQLAFAHG